MRRRSGRNLRWRGPEAAAVGAQQKRALSAAAPNRRSAPLSCKAGLHFLSSSPMLPGQRAADSVNSPALDHKPKRRTAVAKIVFSPPMPSAIMERAHAMLPPGFDLIVSDPDPGKLLPALKDADYYVGFARVLMNKDFFAAGPRLKLVQLISAGYDRVDIDAARQASVPVSNNG